MVEQQTEKLILTYEQGNVEIPYRTCMMWIELPLYVGYLC